MKTSFKSYLLAALIACAMAIFISYPIMCTSLHIKLYFDDASDHKQCSLYYTTAETPNFSEDKLITAKPSYDKADLVLPKSLCSKLENLRLDFSYTESLISIDRIELCSGGFVQETYSAKEFFHPDNIQYTNDIALIQPTASATYIDTSGSDPFIVFQPSVVKECNDAFSHYTVTKLLICIFVAVTIFLARKKIFSAE